MTNDHYYGLILAGGRGTRFWPRSRRSRAKQVLPFLDERSLIQQTMERLRPLLPPERLWVITNDYLRDEIISQLPEVPPEQIIAEPKARNTAPCIGLAAHLLLQKDPDAVLGVFPSDHLISDPERYLSLLQPAFAAAEQGQIAVLGIQPRWAETGYGYIEFPAGVQPGLAETVRVQRFREKPNQPTAEQFVAAGNYYWNAGMFFWRADTVIESLRRHLPHTATLLASVPDLHAPDFTERLAESFPKCDDISIDYAVLEKADNVVGVAVDDIGWNDLGSWNAVYELLPRDEGQNVTHFSTTSLLHESTGNYVDAKGKTVALLGVQNLIVVDTPDALLIADRSRAQDVGSIVKMLEKQGREELL